jgi:hypothetical protein
MSPERRKIFDARVLEVTGKPASEFNPEQDAVELLGWPVLQADGTVNWAMPDATAEFKLHDIGRRGTEEGVEVAIAVAEHRFGGSTEDDK